jgi:hypothetical protein
MRNEHLLTTALRDVALNAGDDHHLMERDACSR